MFSNSKTENNYQVNTIDLLHKSDESKFKVVYSRGVSESMCKQLDKLIQASDPQNGWYVG